MILFVNAYHHRHRNSSERQYNNIEIFSLPLLMRCSALKLRKETGKSAETLKFDNIAMKFDLFAPTLASG
jgi:hypothetical protein